MTPEITGLLDKAKQSAEAAQSLLADNYVDFAASRAYYAMFYALEALLLTKSLSFSKHSAVISAFGKEYIKSGILDPCFHRAVIDAFDLRNAGDYGTMHAVSEELASQTIQNARELIQTILSHIEHIQKPKGFTLVEMAVVMVIVGLLVGLGSAMIGPMMSLSKSRETKEFVGSAVESVNSWAASNNRLPDVTLPVTSPTFFANVAKTPVDAWGRPLIYIFDNALASAPFTKDTICGRRTTQITVRTIDPATTIQNVAFIILSQGDDPLTTATNTFTTFDTAVTGPAVTTSTPIATARTIFVNLGTPTPPRTADDDIVRWVTLDELRSKIGCQGAQLKIVNNELPYGYEKTKYVTKLYIDGGVSGYKWCINSNQPTNLTFIPINSTTGVKNTAITSCTIPTDCSNLANNTGWVDAAAPIFMNISGVPTTRGSYQINVMAHDNNSTNLSQTNCTSKSFVLTINP